MLFSQQTSTSPMWKISKLPSSQVLLQAQLWWLFWSLASVEEDITENEVLEAVERHCGSIIVGKGTELRQIVHLLYL